MRTGQPGTRRGVYQSWHHPIVFTDPGRVIKETGKGKVEGPDSMTRFLEWNGDGIACIDSLVNLLGRRNELFGWNVHEEKHYDQLEIRILTCATRSDRLLAR